MISRHIIFELSKATLISVSCLTILLLYGNLSRYEDIFIKAVQQDPTQVFHLCALLVPYALSMAIPFGFTVSLALVLGNWASNREILALSALGASPRSLLLPFCLFSIFLSCLTIFATLQWGPLNRGEFDKLREKILWENLSLLLIEDGEISFDIDSGKRRSKQSPLCIKMRHSGSHHSLFAYYSYQLPPNRLGEKQFTTYF